MNGRCIYLKIIKNEKNRSRSTWSCYKQYEERLLVQSCFLKRGECRYSNGPFPPDDKPGDGSKDE